MWNKVKLFLEDKSMEYQDLANQIQNDLFEEGAATTMDAISYLPAQVGSVRSAIQKLKKQKDTWNLEILEGDDCRTVQFEESLKITVPNELWEEFQEMFDGQLDENAYLNLKNKIMDAVNLTEENIFEARVDELKAKILEMVDSQEIRTARSIVGKFVHEMGIGLDITPTIEAVIPIQSPINEWVDRYMEGVLFENESDVGSMEILLEDFSIKSLGEGKCLTGGRFQTEFSGVGMVFEVRVSFDKDCFYTLSVGDSEVADCLEESMVGLDRIGKVFYPKVGQILSNEGIFESIKEAIVDLIDEKEAEAEVAKLAEEEKDEV